MKKKIKTTNKIKIYIIYIVQKNLLLTNCDQSI